MLNIGEKIKTYAKKYPNKIAIECGDRKTTYLELEEHTNLIANILIRNYKGNKNVIVIMDNSMELVESAIGIIKSGGIFVPIDINMPEKRTADMLNELMSDWIITKPEFLNKVNEIFKTVERKINVLLFEYDQQNFDEYENLNVFTLNNLKYQINNEAVTEDQYYNNKHCYIYFTSGSTGKPKAVLGRHKSLIHFISWEIEEFKIDDSFKVSQLTSLSFDPFLRDVFVPLCAGGTICIPEKRDIVLNPISLINWIENSEITLIHIVPSLFKLISDQIEDPEKLNKLKYVLLAGEVLRGSDVKPFLSLFKSKIQIVNLYGPTETTLAKMFYRVKEEDANSTIIPVGKPIGFTKVFILNKNLKKCPQGVIGDVYIRTPYITSGYCNDRELTKKVFIKNPFSNNPNDIIYKTGDIGKELPDGNIVVLGREDFQVKVRGIRIELAEIENRLMQYEKIKEAIIIAKEDDYHNKNLYAFYISDDKLNALALRKYLKNYLPEYMIPAHFIQIERFPLTTSGKIDRKKLDTIEVHEDSEEVFTMPTNELQKKLCDMWKNILQVENVGVDSNFFELGGHSLKAARLIAEMYKEFNAELKPADVFNYPTVRLMEEYLGRIGKKEYNLVRGIEKQEYYITSFEQQRMFILNQLSPESTNYNLPKAFWIFGKLNLEMIKMAFNELIERHESLRTSFEIIDKKIVQRVSEKVEFKIEYSEDVSNRADILLKEFIRPFDLAKAPLLRVKIVKFEDEKYILMYDMHHIISDGTSLGILMNEFVSLYNGNKLNKLEIQYKDYAAWQNNLLVTGEIRKQEQYWTEIFSGDIPTLNLPTDFVRPPVQNFEGNNINFIINKELTRGLRKIAKDLNCTMYMILLSGMNILLSKYSGQEDIIIGSPIAGRSHSDLQNIIGMFVNTLAMRNYPQGKKTYKEFLKEVRENCLMAYENQDYQFEELVQKLNIKRDLSRNPLFDVMFTMQNMDRTDLKIGDLEFKEYQKGNEISKFDLTLSATESEEEVYCKLDYSTQLFKKETIEEIIKNLNQILKVISANIEVKLSEICILTEEEKRKIMNEFNNTDKDYPNEKTIPELFEEQTLITPDSVAVVFEDEAISYFELNKKSDQLAAYLQKNGVNSNCIIGIMAERSIEMIIGLLGIMKAGGAYLPIDPEYPEDRIQYMLEDSNSKLLLTQKHLMDKHKIKENINILYLEDNVIYEENSNSIKELSNSKDIAYIIYTSGSTGLPKGVKVEHRNIINTIWWRKKYYSFGSEDAVLQIPSFSFDSSVEDIFTPLISGSRLVMIKQSKRLDIQYLSNVIVKNKISHMLLVPSLYKVLLKEMGEGLKTLKAITLAGESFTEKMVEEHFDKYDGIRLFNEYGPTENSVCSTAYEFTKENIKISIGKPIDNVKCYILGEEGNIQPIGVPGELCVSGAGVTEGYLNKPQITSEKFITNPFETQKRMYKTGDLAKWLPDGNIEFLGRIDNQVKIRGFRIELGEIENTLSKCEGIKESFVVDKTDENGNKFLCAYYLANEEVAATKLRNELTKGLPDYMVPTYFIRLDKMPLTPNGKLDRKSLPEPKERINSQAKYEAPRNEIEEKLVGIWSEILGVESQTIGINDSFFDLGGHSLKATILNSRIHKEFDVEIPLIELFKKPTIRELSECVKNSQVNIYSSIRRIEEKDYYKVSSPQNRIFTLQQMDHESTAYNIPTIMEVEGELDIENVEKVISKLVNRHEAFRTNFEIIDGEVVQKINKDIKIAIEHFECDNEEEVVKVFNKFIRPFDLENAPLFRIGIIILKNRTFLMYDVHHIIFDGVSLSIFIKEFMMLYEGKELEPLKLQYKDYAAWQNEMLESEIIKSKEKYWLDRFGDEIPVLNLPTDLKRPKIKSYDGASIGFKMDKQVTERLKTLCKEKEATLYMVILSAYNILLSKYSGQEDIVIGTPIAGRHHADLQNIIGVFVNTLAMRNFPKGKLTFSEFLEEVKNNSLKAYENQEYQFEELVNNLKIEKNMSRNPLFDTMFVLQNMDIPNSKAGGFKIKPFETKINISKFDLTLNAVENNDEIQCTFDYCTNLFKKETIEKMVEHLKNIIYCITDNPDIKLSEIEMISDEDRRKIIYEFNNTYARYPDDKTIIELFEEQVIKNPEKIAVSFGNNILTYKQLDEKANKISVVLKNRGVTAETIVGIMVKRSLELVIGILGILKAGGGYLPIDPEYPEERVQYMIEDSKAKYILSQTEVIKSKKMVAEFIDLEDESIYINNVKEEIQTQTKASGPNNIAYLIYTSGSTGKPKAVVIENKQVVNYIYGVKKKIDFNEKSNILCLTTISFDIFVNELFTPLLSGMSVVIASDKEQKDPEALSRCIIENKIDMLQATPSRVQLLMVDNKFEACLNQVKVLMIGGEALPVELLERLIKYKNLRIFNMYGPTETTVYSTVNEITDYSKAYIGNSISNTMLYVLNSYEKLQPIGIPGELYISGDGVAREYLNRAELTKEKFVADPFKQGERMYKTGDLVKWLPDGNMEFLGRMDYQVKIRGFRIELGEIEGQLQKHEKVRQAVVIDKNNKDGDKYLCAYIVADEILTVKELREYLLASLPNYMVPSYFIQLEKLPMTPNGKISRKLLPEPTGEIAISNEYEPPQNEIEEKLVAMWRELLSVERVGVKDNFFELGGHSLKATILASKIQKEFEISFPLNKIFENPFIRDIADYIKELELEGFLINNPGLVLLKKGTNKKNIFFIHAASGEIEAYMKLNKLMKNNFNNWGVKIDKASKPYRYEFTIEDIAREYVERIRTVQPEGPYYIMAWCFGGKIAYEIASQLQNMGCVVEFLGLINSPAPTTKLSAIAAKVKSKKRNIEEEWKYINMLLPDDNFKEIYGDLQDPNQLWISIAEELEKRMDIDGKRKIYEKMVEIFSTYGRMIKDYNMMSITDLIYYFNLYRSVAASSEIYSPTSKINTQIYYFIATKEPKGNNHKWKNYSYKAIKYFEIEGDHFSVVEDENDVKNLSDCLNTILTDLE